ncbi:hypothetical protein HDU78_005596 [Chytriomyces hyalinus]|nr:hypothetical protein HDU78_005596 [Chytriomyces hyalinus]
MPDNASKTKIVEVGSGCFNLRAPFKVLAGLVDVGTHMTFARLTSGTFVALSTVALDEQAKAEVDALTNNGELLEAVIATNPFHTLAFEAFYAQFPDAKYYGTPRHIRNIPVIPWSGSIADVAVQSFWKEEGLELEVTAGCEFDAPMPESYNHFSGVVAFHRESKTLICDDCFSASPKKQCRFTTPANTPKQYNEIAFHVSLYGPALYKTPDAPKELYDWLKKIISLWPIENIATAHGGVQVGGAKRSLVEGVAKLRRFLSETAEKRGGSIR